MFLDKVAAMKEEIVADGDVRCLILMNHSLGSEKIITELPEIELKYFNDTEDSAKNL